MIDAKSLEHTEKTMAEMYRQNDNRDKIEDPIFKLAEFSRYKLGDGNITFINGKGPDMGKDK